MVRKKTEVDIWNDPEWILLREIDELERKAENDEYLIASGKKKIKRR